MLCRPLGDSALLIALGSVADETTAQQVQSLSDALRDNPLRGVEDIVPAFTTITVHFDPRVVGGVHPQSLVEAWVGRWWTDPRPLSVRPRREVRVPVRYGGTFGPDLPLVAETTGLRVAEVVELHAGARYTVAAIGFSPGFPYLIGLPRELHVPRRSTPRTSVPAGSVAIAGGQAGIYPQATPGGWNVIGRTELALFDPEGRPPAHLQVGDHVRFEPVEGAGGDD